MTEHAALVEREDGQGGWLILCDHASNRVPERYGDLGLDAETLASHAAWDPGALAVARGLSRRLDAPLVHSTVSRLVADCNRVEDAPDIFPAKSEIYEIPGNRGLDAEARMERILSVHAPYHTLIEEVLEEMPGNPALVAVHSFTPVYRGRTRPWEIGVLHDENRELADAVLARLEARGDLVVGRNEPYSPADGVYYTCHRHGTAHGRPVVMLEIRNDLIRDDTGVARWVDILAEALRGGAA